MDKETQIFSGYTELSLDRSTEFNPRVIFLNAREMQIEKVLINKMEEVKFDYIDTHAALEMKAGASGPLVRDSSHFARVCKDVLDSPELVIQCNRELPYVLSIFFTINKDSTAIVRKDGIIWTNNLLDGPSAWFPCIDGLGQRTHYSLDITFPKTYICVGPGKDQLVATDESEDTNTVRFAIPFTVQPKAIGFALGDFKSTSVINQSEISIQYYSKTNDESFSHTMAPFPELLAEIAEQFLDQDNIITSLSVVYVPSLQEIHSFPGLILYPSNYVVSDGNAAVWVQIVPRIYEALIGQFVYFLLPVIKPDEEWIQHGLVRYFADFFCGNRYKTSFSLERRWNDMNYLAAEDIHPSVVLSALDPATGYPFRDEYLRIKAKLLINMLATSMNNDSTLLLLLRPTLKNSLSNSSGTADKFEKSVQQFCSLINFRNFKAQWLAKNGIPYFTFNFQADARNRQMKFVLYQTPSCKTTEADIFTGHLLVQLRDLEQPHEFKFPVETQLVQQQMKYYAHKPKKKKTKYEFVNGEQVEISIHHSILWVAIDPDHTWLMRVRPRLPQFMVHNMLDLVRDVYSQHETLSSLEEWIKNKDPQQWLKSFLENNKIFYGVRGHAARTLALFATPDDVENTNMSTLISWYKAEFFSNDKPKQNNFQDLQKHFVQLEVIKSMSVIRNNQGYTPREIAELLIQILDQNDNNGNQYSDDNFRVEIALALGRVFSDNADIMKRVEQILVSRVRGSHTNGGFCNHLFSAFYTAITSVLLKKYDPENPNGIISSEDHKLTVDEIRMIIFDDSPYLECKGTLFKCLLFFALMDYKISFSQLFSDVKKLASSNDKKDVAAVCLKEMYRFVLNTLPIGAKDKFECYLFFRPNKMTKEEVIKRMTMREKSLEIAETMWSIMTVDAKYHSVLRSEALRAYTTLYGKDTPLPFLEREVKKPEEIFASSGYSKTMFKIEMKRQREQMDKQLPKVGNGTEPPFNNRPMF
ncbi:hypothetical protein TVAG_364490 [Trichomonas vaginalis G3]|uniref:Transcription initiation factor TFIID subunit 2 n=1 Tax=Trichomonas vaginalis (strain ATCC PRA-98 / G3) TaxID=412133 RepID=A2E9G0_TRIV3|nr:transcription initiation factor TFIID subunit 5 family [Trichomonas vaginalis G3]EAY10724.1 hypothetical protein TVAG_364490 [Trichomonas vaginalis G3]KAI5538617.1 transcription initiation factor TFIID subunit 5 family [Trichomonas vaginalis G3]|eukprot:XP_001322947.1 hypothetical protein [Trichomonas vaginalis G3]